MREYELKLFRCLLCVSYNCFSCACRGISTECCYLLENMESYLFLLLLEVTYNLCLRHGEALREVAGWLEVWSLIVARLFWRFSF